MLTFRMPGQSHSGPLPPLTRIEQQTSAHLRTHVEHLATRIGERNAWQSRALDEAADYVMAGLADLGYRVDEQRFEIARGRFRNVEARRDGSNEIVIVGAHYDTVPGCPGANDNGSGVAALLEIARLLVHARPSRSLRFVAFPNEEAPFFDTDAMGSLQYAQRCRERGENVIAMFSLETLGYYRDAPGTQSYPMMLGSLGYPSRGDFVAFVSDEASRDLLRQVIETFRMTTAFPSEGLAAPLWVPGIGWSDHVAFCRHGYRAVMVTDTAPFRYPEYHTPEDTPDRLDYDRLARVTVGLSRVVAALSHMPTPKDGSS